MSNVRLLIGLNQYYSALAESPIAEVGMDENGKAVLLLRMPNPGGSDDISLGHSSLNVGLEEAATDLRREDSGLDKHMLSLGL